MIEITVTDEGGFGGCTDFIHSLDSAEEIVIDGCARCLGLLLFWTRRKDCPRHIPAPLYAISAFHIPPNNGKPKRSRRQFFRIINDHKKVFDLTTVFYCGGKINTEINRTYYARSKNFFLHPFKYLFPDVDIFGMDPSPAQHSSSMYMNEFLEVSFERIQYTTES